MSAASLQDLMNMGTFSPSGDKSESDDRMKSSEQTGLVSGVEVTPLEVPQSHKGVTEWQTRTNEALGEKLVTGKIIPNTILTEPLSENRQHLDKAVRTSHFDNASKTAFLRDMQAFELRSQHIADNYRRQGYSDASALAKEEVAKTYAALNKLLEAKDNNNIPFKAKDRLHIAQEIINNCAHPNKVSQGFHYTCPTDGLEVINYYRHPADVANVIANVATTGRFTTSSGMTVAIDKASLTPHDEARSYPPADGTRGLAGQIYDLAAVNTYWTRYNATMGTNYRYEQRDPNPNDPSDTGERLIDYSGADPERLMRHGKPGYNPGLMGSEPIDIIAKEMSSHPVETVILQHQRLDTRPSCDATIKSYEDFTSKLKRLAEKGNLPVMLSIDLSNEPFRSDYDIPIRVDRNHPMYHTVLVTEYYPGITKAAVDNLWGSSDDHLTPARLIDTAVLFKAMRHPLDPDNIAEYKQEMQRRRKSLKS